MGRWLGHAAVLACGLALAVPAAAITVSDMRVVSAVGEPLTVDIELADLFGTSEKDISVVAASAADHLRLGMTRPAWLGQLRFLVVRSEQGQVLARGSIAEVVQEPRVSFLVQIAWPGHVRLQQVAATVRQPGDPVASSAVSAPLTLPAPVVIAAGSSGAASAGPAAEESSVIAATEPAAAVPATPVLVAADPAAAAVMTPVAAGRLDVRPGDTLSSLAQSWDADDLSLAQRQQLLYQSNPGAFVNGDINRLRAGAQLALPAGEGRSLPTPTQSAAWLRQAVRGEAAVLARPAEVAASDAAAAGATEHNEVTLTLVAPGKGDQGRAAGEAGSAERAGEALQTRESLATAEQARARLLAERKALSEKLQGLTARSAEQEARLKVLNERLAAFDENAQGVQAAKPAGETDQESGLSGETWVWIIFAGFLLTFLIIRMRTSDDDTPAKSEEARQEPTYAEFTGDEFTPLPADPALAWPDEPEAGEEEYDFLTDSEAEAHQTRLDLAQAYIEMKEVQPARALLTMVQQGGTPEQRQRAGELLATLA